MKRMLRMMGCLLCAMVLCLGLVAQAEEILIDVVGGELRVQNYRVELDMEIGQPIALAVDDSGVILCVMSPEGKVTLSLGKGNIGMTERAQPYVSFDVAPTDAPKATRKPSSRCADCGKPMKDHRCPRCEKRYCVHDDIACGYRLNPAPARNTTTAPDGTIVKGPTIAPDGTYYVGPPPRTTHKYNEWSPGYEYRDAHATPTPGPATPSPSPVPTAAPFNHPNNG